MLTAFFVIGGIGLAAGLGLALASRVFHVYVDPKIVAVEEALPGANCGGCGFPGCSGAASAIVRGEAAANICVGGGPEVHVRVGAILGVKVEEREPEIARLGCSYGTGEADLKYVYDGFNDCRAAMLLSGGTKECPIGCLGLGTCVKACPFGALSMGPDNLPVVNADLCTGCGTCQRICPKGIITLTSATERLVGEYVTDECTAPCQRTCPTGINIPAYIREIGRGNFEEALLIIKEKCPLPLICGHICPAPCELECRRNFVDQGVAINPLKRFVAGYEMTTGKHINPYKNAPNGHSIALIGGGAEGLTAAYYLARLGYQPTIFEGKHELGGILRYVIAGDRLPRKVLDHDIKGILDMGVEAKTGQMMGRDFTVAGLLTEGHDAVMLTGGGFDSRKILQPDLKRFDASIKGLFIMLDFLTALASGEKIDPGKRVILVEGGPNALDLARKCLNMGALKVTIVSHQPQSSMPAELRDTRALAAERIEVRSSTNVVAMEGISGRLTRLVLEGIDQRSRVLWEKNVIEADTVIVPDGRLPELVLVRAQDQQEIGPDGIKWQTIETFRTFPKGGDRGIFSSPEPGRISDSSAVVKAILSGRRLARAVNQHFTGEEINPIEHLACEARDILDVTGVHHVETSGRERPQVADVEGDSKVAWIFPREFPGLDEASARREAERCLQCGLICYMKSA